VYASRSPEPPRTIPIADAIGGAEVVLLATPGAAVPQLLAEHGPALDGRVVIDATNDIGGERLHHADVYEESAPGARFVRAFNTLGFEMFANPTVGGETAELFWCGPDDQDVEQLIADVGLRPVRVGGIEAIDVVDGVGRLWLTLVFREGHPRRLAFRLLAD
jgi:predicted dinucleotide-binding enzyme